jgi:DNA-nicking Smr family endonuclease
MARRTREQRPGPSAPPTAGETDADEAALFLASVGDAVPLADRERVPSGAARAPRRARAAPAASAAATGAPLVVDRDGDRVEGRAAGVNRRQLRELGRGQLVAEARLDLHGMTVAGARVELERFVAQAIAERRRCVLIIHGRGHHSTGGPVLRDAVVEQLAADGARVLGFRTAQPADGGAGALYVLLRRSPAP